MGATSTVRDSFVWEGYRYDIYNTQIDHPDYDTLLQAWRIPLNNGRRSRVILKRLPMSANREQRERAWEELQLAQHLNHPGIARVDGVIIRDGASYVVMESIHGLYLLTVMDFVLLLKGKLSPAFAAYVAAEVADALDYAHQAKDNGGNALHVIHRAVSPARIRLGFDGRVKLTNFGAAYSDLRGRKPSPEGLLRGDPAYCAPEVLRAVMERRSPHPDPLISGVIDGRADVFSLGLILLEMLVAEYPLDLTSKPETKAPKGFARRIKSERPSWIDLDGLAFRLLRFDPLETERLMGDIAAPLREVAHKALQPDPSHRCSAGEMRDSLRAYLKTLPRSFDKYSLEEEVIRIHGEACLANAMEGTPLELTALVLDARKRSGQ